MSTTRTMKCAACEQVGVAGLHCEHCGQPHDVWALGIGVRPTNALRNHSVRTVADLLTLIQEKGDRELLMVRESGEVTRRAVLKALTYYGFVEKLTQKVRVQKRVLKWCTVTEISHRVRPSMLTPVSPTVGAQEQPRDTTANVIALPLSDPTP